MCRRSQSQEEPKQIPEWKSLCTLQHKLVAQATDEVYAVTRERVVQCDEQDKRHRYTSCVAVLSLTLSNVYDIAFFIFELCVFDLVS